MRLYIRIIAAALAIWLGAVGAYAQNAIINSVVIDPSDVRAATREFGRKDYGGIPCALVLVSITGDEEVQFEGNYMKDYLVRKGSEYWVYMIDGTKRLRFHSPKFKMVEIVFADYGIPHLESEVTYRIDVTVPGAITPESRRHLFITVTPADASVYVDGKERMPEDGISTAFLAPGVHTYRIEADGYHPAEGKVRIKKSNEKIIVRLQPQGNIRIHPYKTASGKLGFQDQNGKIVVKAVYDKVFGAGNIYWGTQNGKYGMIDPRGTVLTPCIYDNVLTTNTEGVFIVSRNGYYGVLTESGRLTVPCDLDKVSTTSAKALVVIRNGKYGLVDENGELVIPCENEEITDFYDGLAGIKKDGKCGYINTSGDVVIPLQYDGIGHFSDGVARVMSNGIYSHIDREGKSVGAPR